MSRVLVALFAGWLLCAPASASAQLEEQAARQIALAQEDFDSGNYERAVNSASSALRLNPMLYNALVIKALAYEKLNETMLAYSLLVTYQELTRGIEQDPRVAPALGRLQRLIGAVADSIPPSASPAPAAEAPEGAVETGAAAQFEILSRRNQEDLFEQLNEVLPAGPAYARFRSQSRSKGDDFTFGLAQVRWDGGEAEIDDPAFTLILDSEKLVTKARSGGSVRFPTAQAEHDVQVWYDGRAMALRVDGEALGPFETRNEGRDAKWFLSLTDDARAWDLQVWSWSGSLADGVIPTGNQSHSFEATELRFTEYPLAGSLRDRESAGRLPETAGAAQVKVRMQVTCSEKSYVLLRIDDGREVTVARDIVVRGATKMPKAPGGLRCDGQPEKIELVFDGDGAVWGSIDGRAFPKSYPGRRPDESPELRAKGDTVVAEDIVFEVASRPSGRRVFKAQKPQ